MGLYGANPVTKLVLFGIGNYGNIKILWVGRESSSGLFVACAFARPRGGRADQEWKDFPRGPA